MSVAHYLHLMPALPTDVWVVDQIPYDSKISGKEEQLPISVTVMGPEGSELALLKIIRDAFGRANWPVELEVGPVAFPNATRDISADGGDKLQKKDGEFEYVSLFEL